MIITDFVVIFLPPESDGCTWLGMIWRRMSERTKEGSWGGEEAIENKERVVLEQKLTISLVSEGKFTCRD